jgi:rhodanese-related sulfurtransferase
LRSIHEGYRHFLPITKSQFMLQEAKEVCPTTTRRLIGEGALLVDVREPSEIDTVAFDVPSIMHIPLSQLEQRWSEVPKDREVVVVCQVGARSLKATYFLQYHGYTQVSNMGGGIEKWVRKGFPVKGQLPAVSASAGGCCGSAGESDGSAGGSCCGGGQSSAASAKTSCC